MKILNKLTVKNLRLNKSRTLVTIIGILLSAALITTVAGVVTSGRQTMINSTIQHNGDYDIRLTGKYDENSLATVQANRNVQNVYEYQKIGVAKLENPKSAYRPYAFISAASESAFTDCFSCELSEGRLPQSSDELVLTPEFLKNSETQYSVGDAVSLTIGSRWRTEGAISIDNIPAVNGDDCRYTSYFVQENEYYLGDDEQFVGEFKKTYTVVGIIENSGGVLQTESSSACVGAYTLADFSKTPQTASVYGVSNDMYIKLTPDGEKNYLRSVSELTGLSEEIIEGYRIGEYTAEEYDKMREILADGNLKTDNFYINTELIRYRGFSFDDEVLAMLCWLAVIIIAIIIIASIFVIRNSFAISITEKTKLYGMMSSVGATPRQIKKNVLFESFILGTVGIPLGIGLGTGVTAILIKIINVLLYDSLNNFEIAYSFSWYAIVLAVLLSALTIFLSAYSTAVRASRIAPIEAIRSNTDIKISKKKKEKSYKTPKFISRFFSMGGSIAYKNLKRSRKKYRTTVISIVVSVCIFIVTFSFVEYGLSYSGNYYQELEYNIGISYSYGEESVEKSTQLYNTFANLDGVDNYIYEFTNYNYHFNIDKKNLNSNCTDKETSLLMENGDDFVTVKLMVVAVDDVSYKKAVEQLGYRYEEVKDKGLICNSCEIYEDGAFDGNGRLDEDKVSRNEFLNLTSGLTLNGELDFNEDDPDYDEEHKSVSIEIAGALPDDNLLESLDFSSAGQDGAILVSREWYADNMTINASSSYIYLNAENPDVIEQIGEDMGLDNIHIQNYTSLAKQMSSMVLVFEIFAYGFIIVISLIGLTNIFNTITTNMRLRSKEFAMLRSVGMTKKEFNRMVSLESLFYGVKSLIIGIPLGIIGSWLINFAFNQSSQMNYQFPLPAVLISIAVVFAVIWLIMRFSIAKVRKQNIIETIRNDNI